MARIEFGFGVSDVRGKVGGAIFSGTQAGTIVKTKGSKTHTESGAVTLIRSNMSQINYSWNNLSTNDRNSWISYASMIPIGQKNNKNLFISGRQMFIKYNAYHLLYNGFIFETPVFSVTSVRPLTAIMELAGGDLFITFSDTLVPADEFFVLSVTSPVRSTLNNPGSRFKSIIFTTGAESQFDVTTEYTNLFGVVPLVGQTIFFKYSVLSTKAPIGFTLKTVKVTFT